MRRAREPQPVLLRAGVRALVRADPAGAVVLDAHAREDAVARAAPPVGPGVVLLERPQRGRGVGDDDAVGAPVARACAAASAYGSSPCGQVDRDDVVGRAGEQRLALLRRR